MKVKWLVNFMHPVYNIGTVISIKGDWCVVMVDKFTHVYDNPFVILRMADIERVE